MGLLLFLLKLGSRRQLRFELDSPAALANLNRLTGCHQATLAHSDTLNHFLGHVPPGSLADVLGRMVRRLIRMKALDDGRLFGYFLVVVDATGQLVFRQRHCPHCLTRTVDGVTLYYHHVLEAKLVTPDGLALSIGSEFIENDDPHATKQDCELKAFARLAPRLHHDFPQLHLCLCLDALYANGSVLTICRRYYWKFFITFKEGSLPEVWREYQTLRDQAPQDHLALAPADGLRQTFAWVHDLAYVDDQHRPQRFHAFECREQHDDEDEVHVFAWLTNFQVRPDTVAALANRGARCRWTIENEGFNLQKNGGFNLEHAYSTGDAQIKNFYVLLQIAHLILQLVERGNLLSAGARRLFGSLRALARRLAESLRNVPIPLDALDPFAARHIPIRLDSSEAARPAVGCSRRLNPPRSTPPAETAPASARSAMPALSALHSRPPRRRRPSP